MGERAREALPRDLQEDGMFLLAFFDSLETQRRAGEVLGWRVQRGPEPDVFCMLQVLTPFAAVEGSGKTWHEAHRSLVDTMIATASLQAPKA